MKLLTFNVRFGAGSGAREKPGYDVPSSKAKIAAVAGAIGSVGPDVAALQEVKGACQAERIAAILGMKFVYTRHPVSYALDFFEWGLAFLFNSKLLQVDNPTLDDRADIRRRRKLLRIVLDEKDGPVTFFNVHFDRGPIRRQAERLVALASGRPPADVLMGDFNCLPGDPGLEPVRSRWTDACRVASTGSSREAEEKGTLVGTTSRLDYIFVDPLAWSVDDAGLVAEKHRGVSDHIAYFARIRKAQAEGIP